MWGESSNVFDMQEVYNREIRLVSCLQTSFVRWKDIFVMLNRLGHPCNYTLFYFPVIYHLHESLGLKLLWTAIFTQLVGLVIKWFVGGDRPYWWIHFAHPMENLSVEQFNVECDSSPGGISGHVLVTSAVTIFLMQNVSGTIEQALLSTNLNFSFPKQRVKMVSWTACFGFLLMLALSQLFIAADFPHQVFAGLLLGIFLGFLSQKWLFNLKQTETGLLPCFLMSVIVTVAALVTYGNIFHLVGLEELPFKGRHTNNSAAKSVQHAKRWCVTPSYIVEEHTPFCQMIAIAGLIMGFGFAAHVLQRFSPREMLMTSIPNGIIGSQRLSGVQNGGSALQKLTLGKILKIIVSLISLKCINLIPLPRQLDIYNYYMKLFIIVFFKNCIIPVAIVLVIPHFAFISSAWTSLISLHYLNVFIRNYKRCSVLFILNNVLDWLIRMARSRTVNTN